MVKNYGWVYVLSNQAFHANLLKIGFTRRENLNKRVRELSRATGVPTRFDIMYAAKLANPLPEHIESQVHSRLAHVRYNRGREFFECTVTEAMQTIREIAGNQIISEIDNRPETIKEREAAQLAERKQAEARRRAEILRQQQEKEHRLAEERAKRAKELEIQRKKENTELLKVIIIGIVVFTIIGIFNDKDNKKYKQYQTTNNHSTNNQLVTTNQKSNSSTQYKGETTTQPIYQTIITKPIPQEQATTSTIKKPNSIEKLEKLISQNDNKASPTVQTASQIQQPIKKPQIIAPLETSPMSQQTTIQNIEPLPKSETPNSPNHAISKSTSIAQPLPLSKQYQKAKNDLLNTWNKLPPNIEIELIDEHAKWEENKKRICTNSTGKLDINCDLQFIQERNQYLKTFIIE